MPRDTETMKPPRLIALGGACATTLLRVPRVPPLPAKVLASAALQLTDGMAISAACAFVRLGGQAAVWARVGDDATGRAMRDELAAEGLDVDGLHAVPGARSSVSSVIVEPGGHRLVVPFHDPAVDASPHWLPLQALDGADLLHCDPRWPEGAQAAMQAARERGLPRMLDGDVAPREVLAQLVPLATHLVFSDAGLLVHAGEGEAPPDAGIVEAALRRVAAELDRAPASDPRGGPLQHLGASCGAQGYVWIEDGQVRRVPAPRVEVVDTLAAGDVFHGAFALALLEGQAVDAAARFACTAASLKCTRFGGRLGCPTRAEVDAALKA